MANEAEFLEMYGSKYLTAADLGGKQLRCKIGKTDVTELKDSKTGTSKRRIILYFNGVAKGLVTNKTNATALAGSFGQDRSNWIGVEVDLYSVPTQLGEGIRLRPLKPTGTVNGAAPTGSGPAGAASDMNDSIPFN
jgi:hypothetical protein